MTYQELYDQLMPSPYEMATEKQLSMLKKIAYPTAINHIISGITFGSRPVMTKAEASELIGLIQSGNMKKAQNLSQAISYRSGMLFHLELYLREVK